MTKVKVACNSSIENSVLHHQYMISCSGLVPSCISFIHLNAKTKTVESNPSSSSCVSVLAEWGPDSSDWHQPAHNGRFCRAVREAGWCIVGEAADQREGSPGQRSKPPPASSSSLLIDRWSKPVIRSSLQDVYPLKLHINSFLWTFWKQNSTFCSRSIKSNSKH